MKMTSFNPAKAAVATAVVAGVAFALALPVSADVSGDSPPPVLEVRSPAVIKARGAAVELTVDFTCAAGRHHSLSAFLNQPVGAGIATGEWIAYGLCTGEQQRVVVGVATDLHPFEAKSSYFRVSLSQDDYLNARQEGDLELVNG